MTSTYLEEKFSRAFKESQRMRDDDKLKIISIATPNDSDMASIIIHLTHKRCRKPYRTWLVKVDTVRGTIYWDRSTFYNNF